MMAWFYNCNTSNLHFVSFPWEQCALCIEQQQQQLLSASTAAMNSPTRATQLIARSAPTSSLHSCLRSPIENARTRASKASRFARKLLPFLTIRSTARTPPHSLPLHCLRTLPPQYRYICIHVYIYVYRYTCTTSIIQVYNSRL